MQRRLSTSRPCSGERWLLPRLHHGHILPLETRPVLVAVEVAVGSGTRLRLGLL